MLPTRSLNANLVAGHIGINYFKKERKSLRTEYRFLACDRVLKNKELNLFLFGNMK